MFVFNARQAYNALPDASAVSAANLASLVQYEPVAVGIRIRNLPTLERMRWSDYNTVMAVAATYAALTDAQKAQVSADLVNTLNDAILFFNTTSTFINTTLDKVQFNLFNDTSESKAFICILAAYDERGLLKNLSFIDEPIVLAAKSSLIKEAALPGGSYQYKTFIWDENYVPLTKEASAYGQ